MKTFSQLVTGGRFTLNAAARPDADWVEVHTVKAPDSAVFTAVDYDWHVKNGQLLPLEIDPAEAIALTRALLNEAKATIARQEARIMELEARLAAHEAKTNAADTAQIRLLNRYKPAWIASNL